MLCIVKKYVMNQLAYLPSTAYICMLMSAYIVCIINITLTMQYNVC